MHASHIYILQSEHDSLPLFHVLRHGIVEAKSPPHDEFVKGKKAKSGQKS